MPTAKDHWQPRMDTLDGRSYLDGALYHGPGEHRDANAQSIDDLTIDARSIVRVNRCINHHHVKIGLA